MGPQISLKSRQELLYHTQDSELEEIAVNAV
jgi:hypothetical protein